MTREPLRPASEVDLDALWELLRLSHLFADRAAFESFHAEEPGRVLLGENGTVAVVERWRDHLDVLAVRGIWSGPRDLVDTIAQLKELADGRGFASLLSPLVVWEARGPYLRAGLESLEPLVAYRMRARDVRLSDVPVPSGLRLRAAVADDLPAIDELDRTCFEPFWAYGPRRLSAAFESELVTVAESSQCVIGYTLSTVERGGGTLGRIAVAPAHRHRGVGRALLANSMRTLVDSGAESIGLCAREANATARAMYRAAGMRQLPGKLVFLLGETVGETENR